MVLVIIGILCLYYYRGMGSRFNGQGQERNEKRSLHIPRLAVI